jgi:hypothetical protein
VNYEEENRNPGESVREMLAQRSTEKTLATGRPGHGGGDKHTGRNQAQTVNRKRSVFAPKRRRSWS